MITTFGRKQSSRKYIFPLVARFFFVFLVRLFVPLRIVFIHFLFRSVSSCSSAAVPGAAIPGRAATAAKQNEEAKLTITQFEMQEINL